MVTIQCPQCNEHFGEEEFEEHQKEHWEHKYIYVCPQIVGTAINYTTVVHSDLYQCKTLSEAMLYGWYELGHDDFWIAECSIKNGDVEKCLYVYNSDRHNRNDKESIDIVNNGLGFV